MPRVKTAATKTKPPPEQGLSYQVFKVEANS